MLSSKTFGISLSSVIFFSFIMHSSFFLTSQTLCSLFYIKPALLVSFFSEINDKKELKCYFMYKKFSSYIFINVSFFSTGGGGGINTHDLVIMDSPPPHSFVHSFISILFSEVQEVEFEICIVYFYLLFKKHLRSLCAVILHCTFINITENLTHRNIS